MTDWRDQSIWEAFESAVSAAPEKVLLQVDATRYRYREVWQRAVNLARSFRRIGLGPGDPIALWLPNGIEWAVSFLAATRIGAVVVAVSTRLRGEEIEYLLDQSQAKALLVSHRPGGVSFVDLAYELLPELRSDLPELQSSRFPQLRRVICTDPQPHPGMLVWPELADPATVPPAPLPEPPGDGVALIQYTSGSTARPKGAMLSGFAITRDAKCFGDRIGIGPDDRFFVANPFFHVAGAISGLVNTIVHQATLVTMEHYEAGAALELLERERCTVRLGSEVMYRREMAHPDFERRDLSALKKGNCMGSAEAIRMVYHRMGITGIATQYGLSEGTSVVAVPFRTDPLEVRATTVGRPFDGVAIRIVHLETGAQVGAGTDGEILVRGWNVMKGYYRDPAATAAAIDGDGWFHTGDLGRFDASGNLVFRGRLKDVVRVGAENVSALEVENLLSRHPAIKMVQVVAAPDFDLGEVPVAFVELHDRADCPPEEIIGFCRGKLARFKIPRAVAFIADWPMTANGKIRKVELRERAATLWKAGFPTL